MPGQEADLEAEGAPEKTVSMAQLPIAIESPDLTQIGLGTDRIQAATLAANDRDDATNVSLKATESDTTTEAVTPHSSPQAASQSHKSSLSLNPLRWGRIPPVPSERGASPEYKASFLSLVTFWWVTPMMTTGYKRLLEPMDIWTINSSRTVDTMSDRAREHLRRRISKGGKNPLFWALYDTFAFDVHLSAALALITALCQAFSPFLLRYLIQFAANAYIANQEGLPTAHLGAGIGMVIGIFCMQCVQSLCTNHYIHHGLLIGGQTRAVLISLLYEKAMVLSGRARVGSQLPDDKPESEGRGRGRGGKGGGGDGVKGGTAPESDDTGFSNGRIINLMSVDTQRIDQACALYNVLWTSPILFTITLILLLINITYSALAGFTLLIIGVPAISQVMRRVLQRRRAINQITDQRVTLTHEILSSVSSVKFFGWETAFMDRLKKIRHREITSIQILLSIRYSLDAVTTAMPIFASMLSFTTYSLSSHNLNPAQVFSSLALFNALRVPLSLFPIIFGQVVDAWSSLKRIQAFLLAEEARDETIFRSDLRHGVEVRDGSFIWEQTPSSSPQRSTDSSGPAAISGAEKSSGDSGEEAKARPPNNSGDEQAQSITPMPESEPFKLHGLNLEIGKSELVAVIGTVGSGKSSLLAALAGDMRKTGGEVIMGGSRAFCPQYAWIQNTTVQDNILFGSQMDREKYGGVISACALQPDLDSLPHGDMTEIGERGITISGGQKQRLNIARAIYFGSDVVLMDDPLSAVDAHVGRHMFDKAILGLLGKKCRILATHQLWVLNRCDRIIWMESGHIQAFDTFQNLMRENPAFRDLLATTSDEQMHSVDGTKEGGGGGGANGDIEDGEKGGKNDRIDDANKLRGALMQKEERAVASVPWSTYAAYGRASGSIFNAPFLVLVLIVSQAANIATSLWLSWWTSDEFHYSTGTYIGVYGALGVTQALTIFGFGVLLSMLTTRSSEALLQQAVKRVLRAPMSFFDTTPLGRITNRFSRDVDITDNMMSDSIRMFSYTMSLLIAVFILIIAYFYYFAVALVPLMVILVIATEYYRTSAREVKRIESVLRSTTVSRFTEGLTGVPSIRAYGLRDHFVGELRRAIDEMDAAYFMTFSNQRWLSSRLDLVGSLMTLATGLLVVTSRFSVSPSIGGLVLSYIVTQVQLLQFSVRQLAEVESGMNSVERLVYYGTELEEEAPLHTIELRPSWPETGEIIFKAVEMRYRPGLPLVLRGLSMHVLGGERIGIVGRTGAGKSSIVSTLFRLVELSGGQVIIDGLDISTLGLHDLRTRLAIIPQDPTLFRGTIRSNLDPFSRHTDLELWSALRRAGLVHDDAIAVEAALPSQWKTEKEGGGLQLQKPESPESPVSPQLPVSPLRRIDLETSVEENGHNFSLGQRQMMALARALLRDARIIVCDEATSSVDSETDDRIQHTIATCFRGRTLLCIAHRLRTIVRYDRICVMDAGRIAELDTPLALWQRPDTIFRAMCDRSGIRAEDVGASPAEAPEPGT